MAAALVEAALEQLLSPSGQAAMHTMMLLPLLLLLLLTACLRPAAALLALRPPSACCVYCCKLRLELINQRLLMCSAHPHPQ